MVVMGRNMFVTMRMALKLPLVDRLNQFYPIESSNLDPGTAMRLNCGEEACPCAHV